MVVVVGLVLVVLATPTTLKGGVGLVGVNGLIFLTPGLQGQPGINGGSG